jgi:hypothetical protein
MRPDGLGDFAIKIGEAFKQGFGVANSRTTSKSFEFGNIALPWSILTGCK